MLCTAVLILTTWQVRASGPLLDPDTRLSRALVRTVPDAVTERLADLGNISVAVPVLALAACFGAVRARRAGARRWWLPSLAAALAMAAVPAVIVPLKDWTARPGPLEPWAAGYFPSGHTATAAVAYLGAALVVSPYLRRKWAVPAALALATATGTGLVLRGFHWPLDVLASAALSTLLLLPVAAAARRVSRSTRGSSSRTPSRRTGPS
ncbi:phosphatase PAP2 family protein [Streptomyces sp. NPDC089919]|uniref:phosphatase PAP2 family protein n=1 Tax=Streptomyces sp. NPDC089919 TaxID=3155188 RepID=UPI003414C7DE